MIRAADAVAAMAVLPFAPLASIVGTGTALILAPHPDDESLGCGGLIAESIAQGRPPFVLVVTDGTGSHPGSRTYPAPRLKTVREQETLDALAHLGAAADRVGFLGLRDTAAPGAGPAFDDAVAAILALAARAGAATLLAPWRHDPHCDHLAVHHMAAAACVRSGLRHVSYPVWGWLLPPDAPVSAPRGYRLDIARHAGAKRRAIAAHRSQYGGLVDDDPNGFTLPGELLAVFDRPFETFLDPD